MTELKTVQALYSVLLMTLLLSPICAGQATMGQRDIDEAIQLASRKDPKPYAFSQRFMFGLEKADLVRLYTPFIRVARTARARLELYRPFSAADVTPELLEPVLVVEVLGYGVEIGNRIGEGTFFTPEHVVLSTSAGPVLQPLWTSSGTRMTQWTSEAVRELVAKAGENQPGTGPLDYLFPDDRSQLVVAFPMDVLRAGNEIVVIWGKQERYGSTTSRTEQRFKFSDKQAREWR